MLRYLLLLIIATASCFGQTCTFSTTPAHKYGGIYVGNAAPGRFILIGAITVPEDCVTSGFTFNASHVDSVNVNDHYEMSLYCLSGGCTPLSRVVTSGTLTVPQFFPVCPSGNYSNCSIPYKGSHPHYIPYGQAVESVPWAGGTTLLPAGSYSFGMGTDCLDMQASGTMGGGGNCGEGYGEIGSESQTYDFKVFTGQWPTWKRCLVWNNGLPDALCVVPVASPTNGAPHAIAFTFF